MTAIVRDGVSWFVRCAIDINVTTKSGRRGKYGTFIIKKV